MGKKSRRKGAKYENHIAHLFTLIGWENAKRHLEYQFEEAQEGRDLDGTQPFAVQAKHWKKAPPITTINQVTPSEEYPLRIAVLKQTYGVEVVVMDLKLFLFVANVLKELGIWDRIVSEYSNDIRQWSHHETGSELEDLRE